MQKTMILMDVSSAAHRAFHTTGELTHEGIKTGILFGVFRDILTLKRRFMVEQFAFFFDRGYVYRKELYPNYKANRLSNMSDTEKEARKELSQQIEDLQNKYLPKAGFYNIVSQAGFEADDLMASACLNLPTDTDGILATTDEDLLQCLNENILWYSLTKKKLHNIQSFQNEYGVKPKDWALVKAIAGCHTDNVVGVKGVGEIIASKFIRGQLNSTTKAYRNIQDAKRQTLFNLKLVRLPCPGTMVVKLNCNENRTGKEWDSVMESLGMKSFVGAWDQ